MLFYFVSAILLLVIMLIYFRLADRFNIIDQPNERSSHTMVTIRGGGILFTAAILLWAVATGFSQGWIIAAMMLMALVSFADDVRGVSSRLRMLVHLVAVAILFAQTQVFGLPWYFVAIAFVVTIGWINAFNFMDGINGITAFYSLVALGTLTFLNRTLLFAPEDLLIVTTISVLIFAFFNARKKAKAFAGDVGSVTMAFLLAWMMILLMMKTGRIEYMLLFLVYGIDSAMTIFFRLIRHENIFQAHRSHLYQYLANEMKWTHVQVSVLYALVQLLINIFTIWLISQQTMRISVMLFMLIALSGFYLLARRKVQRVIAFQEL